MEIRRGFFRIENRLMLPPINREMSRSLGEQAARSATWAIGKSLDEQAARSATWGGGKSTRRAGRTVCNMGGRQVTHSVGRRCTFESFIGLRIGQLVAFPHTLRIGKWLSKVNGWSSSPAT
jgi:hypothetical protein